MCTVSLHSHCQPPSLSPPLPSPTHPPTLAHTHPHLHTHVHLHPHHPPTPTLMRRTADRCTNPSACLSSRVSCSSSGLMLVRRRESHCWRRRRRRLHRAVAAAVQAMSSGNTHIVPVVCWMLNSVGGWGGGWVEHTEIVYLFVCVCVCLSLCVYVYKLVYSCRNSCTYSNPHQ